MARKLPLHWSGPALQDLRAIRAWVARDRPQAAKRLAHRLEERVLALREHPELGREVPELLATGYREVIVRPYRIVYQAGDAGIVILRVWDSRRNPEALPQVLDPDDAPPDPDRIA